MKNVIFMSPAPPKESDCRAPIHRYQPPREFWRIEGPVAHCRNTAFGRLSPSDGGAHDGKTVAQPEEREKAIDLTCERRLQSKTSLCPGPNASAWQLCDADCMLEKAI